MTRLCADCGGPLDRGWSNEGFHPGTRTRRCLVCRAIDGLPTFTPPAREKPLHECACGCGRVGIDRGFGLVGACYQQHRPRRECACGCGRVGVISGRGMVNVCYLRLRKAGR